MIIRPATLDDWPRIGELAALLVRTHYAFDAQRFVHPDTLRAADYIDRLREEADRDHAMVRVADVDGHVAGYVFAGIEPGNWKELRHDAGYVHDLVVDEAHRHAGVGRALVDSAIEWFGARGITRIMLWTAPSNAQAQQLFRRIGFKPTMIEMTLDRG
jgi:ribosomal protein S18 acetylase RimI-like enzyme